MISFFSLSPTIHTLSIFFQIALHLYFPFSIFFSLKPFLLFFFDFQMAHHWSLSFLPHSTAYLALLCFHSKYLFTNLFFALEFCLLSFLYLSDSSLLISFPFLLTVILTLLYFFAIKLALHWSIFLSPYSSLRLLFTDFFPFFSITIPVLLSNYSSMTSSVLSFPLLSLFIHATYCSCIVYEFGNLKLTNLIEKYFWSIPGAIYYPVPSISLIAVGESILL